jgi:hypothetical protein
VIKIQEIASYIIFQKQQTPLTICAFKSVFECGLTNQSVADSMSFMTQRSSLINILQLGKLLVLILMILAHYNETTQRTTK